MDQPLTTISVEEYLKIQDTLGYGSEYHDGHIHPLEASTPTHALLEHRMSNVLEQAFPDCHIYDSSLNVLVARANRIYHPDATVLVSLFTRDSSGSAWSYVELTRGESLVLNGSEVVVADLYRGILP